MEQNHQEEYDTCDCKEWVLGMRVEETYTGVKGSDGTIRFVKENIPVLCCENCGKESLPVVREGEHMWDDIWILGLTLGDYLATDPRIKKFVRGSGEN
jgi:hypothetical protein